MTAAGALDRNRYGPWALIAGGSEGVGEAFARRLAAAGFNLVLAARKPEPLQALATDLSAQNDVAARTLALDLSAADRLAPIRAATDDIEVGLLIYNAGSGTPAGNTNPTQAIGDFLDRPLADAQAMIALNDAALVDLVHHFAAGMRARGRGGIVITGSTACHAGTPRTLVYSASKAFQFAFAEGLWYELRPHGVDVLGLILGAVRTPNIERTGMDSRSYAGAAEPADIVEEALARLGRGPIHHACGVGDFAQQLRALPRAEAAARAAQGIDAYFPRP
jgi:short-subunit dehydrogenase